MDNSTGDHQASCKIESTKFINQLNASGDGDSDDQDLPPLLDIGDLMMMMSWKQHTSRLSSNEGFDLQIWIKGQSAKVDEAEGSSYNNDGAELAAESHQKVEAHFALLNPSNLEKEIEEK